LFHCYHTEFNIDEGNTLVAAYPPTFDAVGQFEQTNIADLCLPDGAHIHSEDWTFLFLHKKSTNPSLMTSQAMSGSTSSLPAYTPLPTPPAQPSTTDPTSDSITTTKKVPSATDLDVSGVDSGSGSGSGSSVVYGMAFFKKKSDKSVKRGAVQKSIVCFSTIPAFAIFEPILRATVDEYLEGVDVKGILKQFYTTFRKAWGKQRDIALFNKTFSILPQPGAPIGQLNTNVTSKTRERSNCTTLLPSMNE